MDNIKEIIKSTFIVTLISGLGALAAYIFNVNFIAAFLTLFVIQYILFSFIGDIIKGFYSEKTKQLELEKLEPLSTILECAYCNTKNMMVFVPDENERIEFDCSSCQKRNLVNIHFVVARVTEPVTVPSTNGIPLIETNE